MAHHFAAAGLMLSRLWQCAAWTAATVACGTGSQDPVVMVHADVRLSEVMSKNEGAWIDEAGETDDWIEIHNAGTTPARLSDFQLADARGGAVPLAGPDLAPGAWRVLWADGDLEQGVHHLPFELAASGDELRLERRGGGVIDEIVLPALGENEAWTRFSGADGAWSGCRYASPGADNGASCAPPDQRRGPSDVSFADYDLSPEFLAAPAGLAMVELWLRPETAGGAYVELMNGGASTLALDDHAMRLAPHAPHLPWPGPEQGEPIALPPGVMLPPGERLVVEIDAVELAELEADPAFEGVLTMFERASGATLDRVDFMNWPRGASLARAPEDRALFRFCTNPTRGEPNHCEALPSRAITDRDRHLRTPGDFAALAAGSEQLGIESVKFVVDRQAPGLTHLLGAARWPLHYTFVRERVYREPALDRCDAAQNSEFYQGWSEFSAAEYFRVEGRRFLLGTLSRHASTGLRAVEYALGDAISGSQMRDGFFAVLPHTDDPFAWTIRPQDESQAGRLRSVEGSVPIVGPNAPFENVLYQPLTEGTAYGTLRFVPAGELASAALGPDLIVVTDDVPNDIPLVGGLITEAFQTPLAHVNVLSQSRGTPNASLKGARAELADWFERLIRLSVSPAGLEVSAATAEEASAFWQSRGGGAPRLAARSDTTLRGVQPLTGHGLSSLPAIGAKAAQLAELGEDRQPACGSLLRITTPRAPFAIPLVHSFEHYAASGALPLLDELGASADFNADSRARSAGLERVRHAILTHPVEPALLAEVEAAVEARFGSSRVRFRSSSNTEDLPGFAGAGLYTSASAELGDAERSVADAMRTVWASLYETRAYDERRYANIDDASVGMGILVHEAFLTERANGVAISRNLLDPTRGDIYYVNAQAGEASVTNPAPGVTTEELVYRWGRQPPIVYQGESSLLAALTPRTEHVLDAAEVADLACALQTVHQTFEPLLDPAGENRWFAMEIEFKLIGPERTLLVKQARPHSFGRSAAFSDCREL